MMMMMMLFYMIADNILMSVLLLCKCTFYYIYSFNYLLFSCCCFYKIFFLFIIYLIFLGFDLMKEISQCINFIELRIYNNICINDENFISTLHQTLSQSCMKLKAIDGVSFVNGISATNMNYKSNASSNFEFHTWKDDNSTVATSSKIKGDNANNDDDDTLDLRSGDPFRIDDIKEEDDNDNNTIISLDSDDEREKENRRLRINAKLNDNNTNESLWVLKHMLNEEEINNVAYDFRSKLKQCKDKLIFASTIFDFDITKDDNNENSKDNNNKIDKERHDVLTKPSVTTSSLLVGSKTSSALRVEATLNNFTLSQPKLSTSSSLQSTSIQLPTSNFSTSQMFASKANQVIQQHDIDNHQQRQQQQNHHNQYHDQEKEEKESLIILKEKDNLVDRVRQAVNHHVNNVNYDDYVQKSTSTSISNSTSILTTTAGIASTAIATTSSLPSTSKYINTDVNAPLLAELDDDHSMNYINKTDHKLNYDDTNDNHSISIMMKNNSNSGNITSAKAEEKLVKRNHINKQISSGLTRFGTKNFESNFNNNDNNSNSNKYMTSTSNHLDTPLISTTASSTTKITYLDSTKLSIDNDNNINSNGSNFENIDFMNVKLNKKHDLLFMNTQQTTSLISSESESSSSPILNRFKQSLSKHESITNDMKNNIDHKYAVEDNCDEKNYTLDDNNIRRSSDSALNAHSYYDTTNSNSRSSNTMIYKQLYENKFNRHQSESKLMNNYFHSNNSAVAASDEADAVVDTLFDAVSTSNTSGAVHNHRKSGSSGGVGVDIPR